MESTERVAAPEESLGEAQESCEHEFDTWLLLVSFLQTAPPTNIFRGLSDYRWHLVPSLARAIQNAGMDEDSLYDRENAAIGFFKSRARRFLDRVPDEHDILGWLSLMQHYRAPTRLLDWSSSPFVAAYFAFAGMRSPGTPGALWVLNAHICRQAYGPWFPSSNDHLGVIAHSTVDKDGNEETTYPSRTEQRRQADNQLLREAIIQQYSWPLPLLPPNPDARMSAQQAVFTASGKLGIPVDHLMDRAAWEPLKRFEGRLLSSSDMYYFHEGQPSHVINKIKLPYEWRREALGTLRLMGITADSLFPGLDGIGDATTLHIEGSVPSLEELLG